MSKKCGHKIPCGCKDTAMVTNSSLPDCEGGNPCAENFCADCITWCGPEMQDLGIKPGMPLSDIIQIISIAIVQSSTECVKTNDPNACKSLIFDFPVITTNTTATLSWTYLAETALDPSNTNLILVFASVDGGTGGKLVIDIDATSVMLENLLPDTEYCIYMTLECGGSSGAKDGRNDGDAYQTGTCISPKIVIKTLKD